MITQARLKELLHYDPETGIFTRKVAPAPKHKVGQVAGWTNVKGYREVKIDFKCYKMHRLAWLYMTGVMPPDMVDHINGIKDDNRFDNLRLSNNGENLRNSKMRVDNTSGCKGVQWHKHIGKWRATISIDKKRLHLGYFTSLDEAVEVVTSARNKLHKEFARHD